MDGGAASAAWPGGGVRGGFADVTVRGVAAGRRRAGVDRDAGDNLAA
jgi:hypothetical protein